MLHIIPSGLKATPAVLFQWALKRSFNPLNAAASQSNISNQSVGGGKRGWSAGIKTFVMKR